MVWEDVFQTVIHLCMLDLFYTRLSMIVCVCVCVCVRACVRACVCVCVPRFTCTYG